MLTSESTTKLLTALHAARGEIGKVHESGKNTFDKYDYAKITDYVAAIQGPLKDHSLIATFSIVAVTLQEERKTAKGSAYAYTVELHLRITHVSGEWIQAGCFGEGQDRADKALAKAVTAARKSGLACLLNLATGDDPEQNDRRERRHESQAGSVNELLGKQSTPKVEPWTVNAARARAMVAKAWKARGLGDNKNMVLDWLSKHKASSIDKASPALRQELLDAINNGEFDNSEKGE